MPLYLRVFMALIVGTIFSIPVFVPVFVLVQVVGWYATIGIWLSVGYLGACLICGLITNCFESARVMTLVVPRAFDAPPTLILICMGLVTFYIWVFFLVVTESITHQRGEYLSRYKPSAVRPRLQLARALQTV